MYLQSTWILSCIHALKKNGREDEENNENVIRR
jgi:hypothetical protein